MEPVTIGFILYLIMILALGLYTARITRSLKDFALGGNRLGPWVIAAMMSTADSQLLVSTTVLTEDIIARFFRGIADRFSLLSVGRTLTIGIGIVAFYLAWQTTDLVFEMVSYAWGGLGASFGPALLLTLWWRRVSKSGVIAGMICGTTFTVIDLFGQWITARLSAFLIAFLAVVLVSLWWPDEKPASEL